MKQFKKYLTFWIIFIITLCFFTLFIIYLLSLSNENLILLINQIKSWNFTKIRIIFYLVICFYFIWKYYYEKIIKFEEYKKNFECENGKKIKYTCLRYITRNKKIYFFQIMIFFETIILDFFISNYFNLFKDIWPLVTLLLSPFATSMYIIANNVWSEDKTRDIVTRTNEEIKDKQFKNNESKATKKTLEI